MSQNVLLNSKNTFRSNIQDYISQDHKGGVFLHKTPVAYDDNGKWVCTTDTTVLDLIGVLELLEVSLPVEEKMLYSICELILQKEENNPGSLFTVGV